MQLNIEVPTWIRLSLGRARGSVRGIGAYHDSPLTTRESAETCLHHISASSRGSKALSVQPNNKKRYCIAERWITIKNWKGNQANCMESIVFNVNCFSRFWPKQLLISNSSDGILVETATYSAAQAFKKNCTTLISTKGDNDHRHTVRAKCISSVKSSSPKGRSQRLVRGQDHPLAQPPKYGH